MVLAIIAAAFSGAMFSTSVLAVAIQSERRRYYYYYNRVSYFLVFFRLR